MRFEGPILVGMDGTKSAARACAWAASVAEAGDRLLVAGHAHDVGDYPAGPNAAAATSRDRLHAWLAEVDLGPRSPGEVKTVVGSGRTGPVLVEIAAIEHAALLVVGAPHVGGIAPHGLGRTAHHLTLRSVAPVAFVRHLGGPVASSPIVLGVDPADYNADAITWSLDLASRLGASLDVVAGSSDPNALDDLEGALENLSCPSSPIVHLVHVTGDPAAELMRRSGEIGASAIVVGQKRRRNARGRLLGRVPSKLLHQSRQPLILLPHS